MLESLRKRLEIEYQVTSDIWVLNKVKIKGKMGGPSIVLSDEQITFIKNLLQYEGLSIHMVNSLYGYTHGSQGLKKTLKKLDIDFSSKALKTVQQVTKQTLKTSVEVNDLPKGKGHTWISNYLDEMKWEYLEEWTGFPDNRCINPKTNHLLKFDFYIPHLKLVVEYHGRQHYSSDNWYHEKTSNEKGITQEKAYEEYVWRDSYKYEWAIENDLEYLEISYSLFDNKFPLSSIFAPYIK